MDAGEFRGRIAWLNTEGGFQNSLNEEAIIEAGKGVASQKIDKILQDLETNKDNVKDPTAWVSSALRKEKGGGTKRKADAMPMMGGGSVEEEMKKVRKRVNWLNGTGGFQDSLVLDKILAAAGGLPFSQVLHVLKELEEKRDGVKDPNAWVCSALRKVGGGQGGPASPSAFAMSQPAWQAPPPGWGLAPPGFGGAQPRGQMDAEVDQKLRKRIGWLNSNAGFSQPLNYPKVSEAAVGLDLKTVMAALKDLEEKKEEVRDPTAYVTTKMRKSGGGGRGGGQSRPAAGGGDWMAPPMQAWGAPAAAAAAAAGGWTADAEAEDQKLRKRIGWLNKNGFNGNINYQKVMDAAGGLEFTSVFEKLKQLEAKGDSIKDPTGWLVVGLRKESEKQGPAMQMMAPAPFGMPFGGPAGFSAGMGMDRETESKLHKRIKWLNGNGGFDNALVFDKVKEAVNQTGVDWMCMQKVLKDLEEKKDTVKDPTAYVSSAFRKQGGGKGGGGKGPRGVMGVQRTIGKVKHEF